MNQRTSATIARPTSQRPSSPACRPNRVSIRGRTRPAALASVSICTAESRTSLSPTVCSAGNLDHRGASGAEINTGDGAGILIQMPHSFFAEVCKSSRITLPEPGQYGVGLVFLPRNPTSRRRIEEKFEQVVQSEGQTFLGWRTVPTNSPRWRHALWRTVMPRRHRPSADPTTILAFDGSSVNPKRRITNKNSHGGAE